METIKSSLEEKVAQSKEEKRAQTNENQINIINKSKSDVDETRLNQAKGQNQVNSRISRISFSTTTNSAPLNENASTTRAASTNLKSNQTNYVNEEILYLNNNQKQIRPNTSTASSLSNRNNLTPGKKMSRFFIDYNFIFFVVI